MAGTAFSKAAVVPLPSDVLAGGLRPVARRADPLKAGRREGTVTDEARREAIKLNDARGGPGFHVERRDDYDPERQRVDGPYAYIAEETSPDRWYASLRLMRGLK